ncbi:amino acid ABC transporter ATP-binding protein [Brevibacillus choshinensis]|uniref:amino acid ABC transporter ATP-binding protein n=1 Tax=Brevibacillus choshinensis TaxID=54911 RepID=UPI002E230C02|nr:amino acid ABC transporter ATP-binding protein [Brevibacillus choshinensis]
MIQINQVNKSYGSMHVLKDIQLEVPQSHVYALIGPSGAGKSTLIRSINALESIQGGEIIVDGISVHDKKTNINLLRSDIGFVFQSFNLYPHLTAMENVAIAPVQVKNVPKEQAEEKAKALLTSLGLGEKCGSYPNQLSGGQQQRVAIARALAMDPKVMLFDEPTSALDPEMIKEVLDAIRNLASTGMTMVVVTHEMGFAREICNQIVFMADGKIVEVAPPEKFFTNPQTERAKDFLSKVLNH